MSNYNSFNDLTVDKAKDMISYLPQRPDYDMWIRVISAIGNYFNENESLSILLSRFSDETPNEHYNKLQNKLENIGIGTFIYYCQEYGAAKNDFNKSKFKFPPEQKQYILINENETEPLDYMEPQGMNPVPIYDIAINYELHNKNIKDKPLESVQCIQNGKRMISELIHHISEGRSFVCGRFANSEKTGKPYRDNKHFIGTSTFALDIDSGMTIKECFSIPETINACLLYTTQNHTESNPRFRIVFTLDKFYKNREFLTTLKKHYAKRYNADIQATDNARNWAGNDNAIIYYFGHTASAFNALSTSNDLYKIIKYMPPVNQLFENFPYIAITKVINGKPVPVPNTYLDIVQV